MDCFKINTITGTLNSLWEAWDINLDEYVDNAEFKQAIATMDLDNNGETNMLEVQAYFATNGYLICRPLREETLERHNATIQEMLRQID